MVTEPFLPARKRSYTHISGHHFRVNPANLWEFVRIALGFKKCIRKGVHCMLVSHLHNILSLYMVTEPVLPAPETLISS